MLCKHEVVGSIPSGSTNFINLPFVQAYKWACAGEIEAALGMVQSAACRK